MKKKHRDGKLLSQTLRLVLELEQLGLCDRKRHGPVPRCFFNAPLGCLSGKEGEADRAGDTDYSVSFSVLYTFPRKKLTLHCNVVHPSFHSPVLLSIQPFICTSLHPPARLSLQPPLIHLSTHESSAHISIHIHPFIHPLTDPFMYTSIHPPTH